MVEIIGFPADELPALRKRLSQGLPIYTTRIDREFDKYHTSEILASELGRLVVESVQRFDSLDQHPFLNELTREQQDILRGHEMDLVKLVRG